MKQEINNARIKLQLSFVENTPRLQPSAIFADRNPTAVCVHILAVGIFFLFVFVDFVCAMRFLNPLFDPLVAVRSLSFWISRF